MGTSNRGDIAIVMKKFWFGDWFIMMQLCKEIHPAVFHEMVIELRDRLDPKRADNLEMRNGNTYRTLPRRVTLICRPWTAVKYFKRRPQGQECPRNFSTFFVSGNCSSKCIFVNQSMISGEYVGPLHRQCNFLHSYISLKSNHLRIRYVYIICIIYNTLKYITVNVFICAFAHITNHVFKTI